MKFVYRPVKAESVSYTHLDVYRDRDSLSENNKSFIGKVANDLFRSMNLAQAGLNLDTDDLKQAGNLGLWKACLLYTSRCV